MHPTTRQWLVAVAAALLAGSAGAAGNCEALRAEIEAKISAAGVTRFSVRTLEADAAAGGKVVGSCDLGSKKIVYETQADPASGAPSPAARSRNPSILTECRDGSVSVGGDCSR